MLPSMHRRDTTEPPSEGGSAWLAIAAGGAIGALMRFGFNRTILTQTDFDLWIATGTANVLGAFALGALLTRLPATSSPLLRPFFATGVLGSFTTFSTLLLENSTFFQTSPAQALIHLVGVIGLGLIAFPAGEAFGRISTPPVRS